MDKSSKLFRLNAMDVSSKLEKSCRLWMSRCYALFHSSSSFVILSVSFQSLIFSSHPIFHFVPFIPFHLLLSNVYSPPPLFFNGLLSLSILFLRLLGFISFLKLSMVSDLCPQSRVRFTAYIHSFLPNAITTALVMLSITYRVFFEICTETRPFFPWNLSCYEDHFVTANNWIFCYSHVVEFFLSCFFVAFNWYMWFFSP